MSHIFYALYEIKTLNPVSIGGVPFVEIPEGFDTCTLSQQDAESLLSHQRRMHDHFLSIENGHGTLKNKLSTLLSRRDVISNNIVRDLDYRIMFFDHFNIKVSFADSTLTLDLDLDSLEEDAQQTFKDKVTEKNRLSTFYVTAYQDPTKLLCKFNLDLHQLSKDKTFQTNVDFDNTVSVWARQI